MFPAYLQTRKRDVVTDNYLLPFFPVAAMERVLRAGSSGRWSGVNTRTPPLTRVVRTRWRLSAATISSSLCGRVRIRNDLGLGPRTSRVNAFSCPSTARNEVRRGRPVTFGLSATPHEDREGRGPRVAAPSPLVQFSRGEGKSLNRVWPLFAHGKTPPWRATSILGRSRVSRVVASRSIGADSDSGRALLYVVERNTSMGTIKERIDLWPLFVGRRDPKGNTRLQVFAPLEPLLPGIPQLSATIPALVLWRADATSRLGRPANRCSGICIG